MTEGFVWIWFQFLFLSLNSLIFEWWVMEIKNTFVGIFKLWKLSFRGILVNTHCWDLLVLSSQIFLLSPTSHSFFFSFPLFFLFVSLLSLFLFLFFFRAKSHPHRKTKESQPSPSTASLLRSACCSLSFTLATPTHPTNNISTPLNLGLYELWGRHGQTRMVVVGLVSLIMNPKHPISKRLDYPFNPSLLGFKFNYTCDAFR